MQNQLDKAIEAKGLLILAISLRRSVERRLRLSGTMQQLGIEFRFLDAVDATNGFVDNEERALTKKINPALSDGEFACAMSHRKALREFVESAYSHAIIMEDDADPQENLYNFVAENMYLNFDMLLLYHKRALVKKNNAIRLPCGIVAFPLAINCSGAVAYCISKAAALKVEPQLTPVRTVADWPIDLWKINAHVVVPRLVEHTDRDILTTTIPGARAIERQTPDFFRFFKPRYLIKKWRKIGAELVS